MQLVLCGFSSHAERYKSVCYTQFYDEQQAQRKAAANVYLAWLERRVVARQQEMTGRGEELI